MALAIQTRNLSYAFGTGEAKTPVLFGIDLEIQEGEVVVLKGASGSGKTTLLTLLACLRALQDGEAHILGHPLAQASPALRVHIRRRLGFIFQAHNLHDALSALQNVRVGLEVHGKGPMTDWRASATHLLGLLGLAERAMYKPAKLSGGQKQRVAIARALIANPDLVFADEPTAALDADSGRRVIEILQHLGRARKTTSVIVTHDDRVIKMADRVLTLDQGRLISDERPNVPSRKETVT